MKIIFSTLPVQGPDRVIAHNVQAISVSIAYFKKTAAPKIGCLISLKSCDVSLNITLRGMAVHKDSENPPLMAAFKAKRVTGTEAFTLGSPIPPFSILSNAWWVIMEDSGQLINHISYLNKCPPGVPLSSSVGLYWIWILSDIRNQFGWPFSDEGHRGLILIHVASDTVS